MRQAGFMPDCGRRPSAFATHRRTRLIESGTQRFGLAALAIALVTQAAPASTQSPAESFPSRPIRIAVPFGPGSGTDTATRMLGQQLEAVLKQGVVFENKPGANGVIAATALARATPDGYTLLMGANFTHGANPGLVAKLGYDPVKDFAPAGTPTTVVNRLSAELQKLLAAPETRQRLLQIGAEAKWMGPADFKALVATEVVRLPKILAEIGVQPQ